MKAMKNPESLFINNAWVKKQECDEIINPATEEVVAKAPVASVADVEGAVAAARHAFDNGPWPTMTARERKGYLEKFYDAVMKMGPSMMEVIVETVGATAQCAQFQFYVPMMHAKATLDVMERESVISLPVEVNPSPLGGSVLGAGVSVRAPVGVVSLITPYNFPHYLNIGKAIQALAVGCTVVLKPSPFTPFEALMLGEAALEAGLPEGVLNIVNGGVDIGEVMTTDPRVDLVSFTGSDKVGSAIQAQAAPTLKRVLLELGGKSPLIVREDADLDIACTSGLTGFTFHAGQGCGLLTRHLVHNSIKDAYVERLVKMAESIKVGDPSDPTVTMGPLIREAARARTEHYVASALEEGASVACGGRRPPELEKGYFYEPTLLVDVHNGMRVAQEEIFGPVGVVIGFDSDEEAVTLANDSQFGLCGGVVSADTGKAYEIAMQLQTGKVDINGGAGKPLSHAPFGGVKRSGYGREYGVEGLNEFTYLKTIQYKAL